MIRFDADDHVFGTARLQQRSITNGNRDYRFIASGDVHKRCGAGVVRLFGFGDRADVRCSPVTECPSLLTRIADRIGNRGNWLWFDAQSLFCQRKSAFGSSYRIEHQVAWNLAVRQAEYVTLFMHDDAEEINAECGIAARQGWQDSGTMGAKLTVGLWSQVDEPAIVVCIGVHCNGVAGIDRSDGAISKVSNLVGYLAKRVALLVADTTGFPPRDRFRGKQFKLKQLDGLSICDATAAIPLNTDTVGVCDSDGDFLRINAAVTVVDFDKDAVFVLRVCRCIVGDGGLERQRTAGRINLKEFVVGTIND